jgi:hypothetical protein
MTKITVYRYDEMNSPVEAQGWFTLEDAEAMPEADPMTAARHAQAMRRGEPALGVKETLYRTSHGRWVLKASWHIDECGRFVDDESDVDPHSGGGPRYQFLTDAHAIDWLRRNHYEDKISSTFPSYQTNADPAAQKSVVEFKYAWDICCPLSTPTLQIGAPGPKQSGCWSSPALVTTHRSTHKSQPRAGGRCRTRMVCWCAASPQLSKGVEQVRLPTVGEHRLLPVLNRPEREL